MILLASLATLPLVSCAKSEAQCASDTNVALQVLGSGGPFPGLEAWLTSLLDSDAGAYGYLSGFLDGTGGRPMLVAKEIASGPSVTVYKDADMVIDVMHVPHGIVPAVAFKESQ